MNDQLQTIARNTLKNDLPQCTEAQQLMFKRMYAHDNLDLSIKDIIDQIPEDKLDWAMQQVQRTLIKMKEERS